MTKDDISCLLGDHLRTIEQLQHVRDTGRLHTTDSQTEKKERLLSAPSSRKETSSVNKRKKPPSTAHPNISNNQNKASNSIRTNAFASAKNKMLNKSKGNKNVVRPLTLDKNSSDSESTMVDSSDCDTPKPLPRSDSPDTLTHSDSPEAQTYWVQQSSTDHENEAAEEAFTSLNAPMLIDSISSNSNKCSVIKSKLASTNMTRKSMSDKDFKNLPQSTPPTKQGSKLKKSVSLDEQQLNSSLPAYLVNIILFISFIKSSICFLDIFLMKRIPNRTKSHSSFGYSSLPNELELAPFYHTIKVLLSSNSKYA